jgi:hypothetical protein
MVKCCVLFDWIIKYYVDELQRVNANVKMFLYTVKLRTIKRYGGILNSALGCGDCLLSGFRRFTTRRDSHQHPFSSRFNPTVPYRTLSHHTAVLHVVKTKLKYFLE